MLADLMFRKQNYETAINLYRQVLEKAPGNGDTGPLPHPARAALPEKGGPSPLLPGWAEEAPSFTNCSQRGRKLIKTQKVAALPESKGASF